MMLDSLIKGTSQKNTLCIEGLSTANISLVGTNLQASVSPNSGYYRFLQFIFPEGISGGIIALSIRTLPSKRYNFASFLIPVQMLGDTVRVDFIRPWISDGKLAQIVGEDKASFLQVTIGSNVYTSDPDDLKHHHAVDPNLLCRYLADEITAKEVEVAAKCHQEEMSASEELAKIRNAMGSLQETLETSEFKREKLEALVAQIRQDIIDLVNPIVTSLNGATFNNRKEVILQASVSLQNLRTILLQQLKAASYC